MEKIRVLVCDDNNLLRTRIATYLESQEDISCCDTAPNGAQAVTMLGAQHYDVVLMDIILQQVDGFGVIEQVCQMQTPPRVIVISALAQDEIIRRVCELGAYYYIIKPFSLESLYARIKESQSVMPAMERELLRPGARAMPPIKSLDERIANVFLAVGIPAHIKGYHFLRDAVKLVYKDRTIINCITKELYPGVATIHQTTPSKVERAIRHAIEVAWQRGKIENINGIFGYTIYNSHEKPTNGEFIALIADKLIMDDLTRNEQKAAG